MTAIPEVGRRSPSRNIHHCAGVGIAAEVLQHKELLCRRLASAMPSVIVVMQGAKTVRNGARLIEAGAGDIVLVPAVVPLDVINRPDRHGNYRAFALSFEPSFIRELHEENGHAVSGAEFLRSPPVGLVKAIETAMSALADNDLPHRVIASRVGEVILWLSSLGYHFTAPVSSNPVDRVRVALASDPAHNWKACQVAAMVNMSEASLRRRFAAANSSLTEMLIDIRMSAALALLQSTDKPVTTIALEVGYDSASRFSARFRARFNFSPTELRSKRGTFDRIGTKYDRERTAMTDTQ